jgi:hypothetical protein
VVEVDERVGRPDPLLQFLARNYFARSLQQNLQELKGLLLESHLRSVLTQFSCILIQFELSEPDDGS